MGLFGVTKKEDKDPDDKGRYIRWLRVIVDGRPGNEMLERVEKWLGVTFHLFSLEDLLHEYGSCNGCRSGFFTEFGSSSLLVSVANAREAGGVLRGVSWEFDG